MTTITKEKKHPAAIQALLDVLAAEQAKVAANAAATGRASDVSTADVESARILAEVAASMIPKAAKATADEKAHAKAVATVNSLALAIGDRRAKRVPQPASILGYKMLGGASKARGVKGAKPAAKAWRALTGAACAAGILTAEQALEVGKALTAKAAAKAA